MNFKWVTQSVFEMYLEKVSFIFFITTMSSLEWGWTDEFFSPNGVLQILQPFYFLFSTQNRKREQCVIFLFQRNFSKERRKNSSVEVVAGQIYLLILLFSHIAINCSTIAKPQNNTGLGLLYNLLTFTREPFFPFQKIFL